MMDSRPILPKLFHPQSPRMSLDFRYFVSPRSRTRYPVKYYFTDFGHSRRYDPDDKNPSEVPLLGGDKTVPEFRNDRSTPRNPFHTDVYYMGNLIRRYFIQVCQRSMVLRRLHVLMLWRRRNIPTSGSWTS